MLANIAGDWPWIALVIIVLFGGTQLPKLARNAGEAMKEFRKAHNEATADQNAAPVVPAAYPAGPAPALSTSSSSLPAGVPAGATAPGTTEERVTLTRSELDALLAHREAEARGAANTPPPSS